MRMSEKQPTIAKYNMDLWGKDHWSVFAYIHDLCVNSLDNIGTPDLRRIQCNLGRHPGLVSMKPNDRQTA